VAASEQRGSRPAATAVCMPGLRAHCVQQRDGWRLAAPRAAAVCGGLWVRRGCSRARQASACGCGGVEGGVMLV
jgi:hypothetical protein